MELKFRDLRADEIEVRVGSTRKDKNGEVIDFGLLLYKNARVDMALLDETVGAFNWQAKYYQVKNTMICSVGIYNEERKEWLWKDNGGDDDFTTEQVKAECSDAFKRACFLIGIGRKLYSASKLYMRVNKTEENTEKSYYAVKSISYDDDGITKVVIINKKTKKEVITATLDKKVSQNADLTPKTDIVNTNEPKGSITLHDKALLQTHFANADVIYKVKLNKWLEKNYATQVIEELTNSQGKDAVARLGLEN